jgi:hypothetical protein
VTISRRTFLRLAGLGGLAWAAGLRLKWPAPAAAGPGGLRLSVTGWRPTAEDLAGLSAATGLALEVIEARSGAELAEADLALVPAHVLPRLIEAGGLRALTGAAAQPDAGQRPYDPQAIFSRLAGRGAVGINSRGGPAPEAWADFFRQAPDTTVHLPAAEAFGAALLSLGQSINTRDASARQAAANLIGRLTSQPLESARWAVGPRLAGWQFTTPAGGAELWEACWCLPAASARPDAALAVINAALARLALAPLPDGKLEPRSAFGLPPVPGQPAA